MDIRDVKPGREARCGVAKHALFCMHFLLIQYRKNKGIKEMYDFKLDSRFKEIHL